MKEHTYETKLNWTGNTGRGTADYRAYERSHTISVKNKPDLFGSSDPTFRGDFTKYNPEELLVASLSACHMLWYLHLCSQAGIVVVEYSDNAVGEMEELKNGSGHFKEVSLNPRVKITDPEKIETANKIHHEANKMCFIANSVKFPVFHRPVCVPI
jgi:organic hydroperoxide reductase OsmC/OhrA